jgi:hypothetical protein
MTMFDVERDNKMFVPSLYHSCLPPAYAAGVRVHSNSWGCRGITSYTSKVDNIIMTNSNDMSVFESNM